jgi:hypothetical protein
MGLCGAQSAGDGFADLVAFLGFRIAADVDADHPQLQSAADNLASFSGHILPP